MCRLRCLLCFFMHSGTSFRKYRYVFPSFTTAFKPLHVDSEIRMRCVALADGGGAVYLSVGSFLFSGSTWNTAVTLTNCTMTNNAVSGVY